VHTAMTRGRSPDDHPGTHASTTDNGGDDDDGCIDGRVARAVAVARNGKFRHMRLLVLI
jgi:hypothetical protein